MTEKTPPVERKTKLAERQARGAEADTLLNSKILKEAFAFIRKETMAVWQNTDPDETELREICFHRRGALDDVEDALRAWQRSGEGAAKELLKLKDDKPKV